MGENEIIRRTEKTFEDIKHIDENGIEYWYARELMVALGYKDWRYFDNVIEKAKIACKNSAMPENKHFVVDNKTLKMPENLPTPEKSVKELEKEKKKQLRLENKN